MKVYETEVQDIQEYKGGNLVGLDAIDPRSIYGFPDLTAKKAVPVITDHPDFPNPRTSPMSEELKAEIREAGQFDEPVVLFERTNDNNEVEYVLVNGKTRLTSVAEEWAENPETDKFSVIPFVLYVADDENEVRMHMAKINLEEARTPLSALETAKYLLYMENEHGLSEDDQAKMLNKTGRGGIRWIREMKRVAGLPDVAAAVEAGDIDDTTAKEVAKLPGEDQRADVIKQVKDQKKAGKSEADARKNVVVPPAKGDPKAGKGKQASTTKGTRAKPAAAGSTLTKQSKTTLGWKEAFNELCDFYGEAKKFLLDELDPDAVTWTNAQQRTVYITQCETIARYREYMKFLKLDSLKQNAQFDAIEAWIPATEREAMKLVAHEKASTVNVPEEPSGPKGKTAGGAAKGGAATKQAPGKAGGAAKGGGAKQAPKTPAKTPAASGKR